MDELTLEIIQAALRFHVDDIHVLPGVEDFCVYFRNNGQLTVFRHLSEIQANRWINYLKYCAGMDIGEKRRPQSGAMRFQLPTGLSIELRLSTITNFKQQISLVIRLLHLTVDSSSQKCMSYFPADIQKLETYLRQKNGLILFSGPVSSGKTSTMYQLLRQRIEQENLQVITMEEPVEICEPRFLQTEVNEKAGISYDGLIKSSLRHHPDVMLIGEIRDEMTAKMVVRGALTGHLMLATVHAKDCRGVISRLEELGISRNLMEQTLLAIVTQRLIPRWCGLCQGQCNLYCNHHQGLEKRGIIFDIADGRRLHQLLEDTQNTMEDDSWNRKLRKAYGLGFISQNSFEAYQLY